MEKLRREQLLAELQQYIEENYEGARLLPAYPSAAAAVPQPSDFTDIQAANAASVRSTPCVDNGQLDEEDPFDDIFHIFKGRAVESERKETIEDTLDAYETVETFTEALLRIIKTKNMIEADVYNSVFMDRKLFNKIRNDRFYQPSKRTALLLAIALHLDVDETNAFLEKAGFTLTHTSKTDIIIEFFMLRGIYDIIEINHVLYEYHLPLLSRQD